MAQVLSNLLLNSIPAGERKALVACMEQIQLPSGTILYRTGEQPEFAHFMTSGIASVVTFMANGSGVEVGLIGKEGLVEAVNLLGPASPPTTAFIQVEGTALRMRFAELRKKFQAAGPLQSRILEFVQRNGYILSQLAACNGKHEIEERLSRWLLMVQDRVESDHFYLTQEFLAEMLGIRRTSVSATAASLQKNGLIKYRRGNIRIVDRARLQAAACECYPIVQNLSGKLGH
ncbi:MAG TPA: Crp/Fnr family transcriptional regulator [Terracidiphilus sp.]|nr:Crp/Fnr family transcriptional regulator [Terracidiphilus sp.]